MRLNILVRSATWCPEQHVLTAWTVRAVPAGTWLKVYFLVVFPVLVTVNVWLNKLN